MFIDEGFRNFTLTSGLAASRNKSVVYFGNVKEQVRTQIIELCGFSKGKPLFRYLEVPISSKRSSAVDCEILVDKIALVSNVGDPETYLIRWVQLINSILMSLYTYWATIFIIPQSMLNSILSVCRNYLWEGKELFTKSPPITWETICSDKTHGGLNVRDGKLWNIAAMGKYIWQVSMKSDNLWVKWIHWVYIHNDNFWLHVSPLDASWAWKKLCKLKHKFAPGCQWTMEHSSSETYKWLQLVTPKMPWRFWVWNKLNVPKHSIICWLAMWEHLRTKDKLYKLGVSEDDKCSICGGHSENITHLFFECVFSNHCITAILQWLGDPMTCRRIQGLWRRIQKHRQLSKFRRATVWAALAATLYLIWWARNEALWQKLVPRQDVIIGRIKRLLADRIRQCMPKKISSFDRAWFSSL